jgi:ssDNA-binding Zn-finger/Zn-ribbon topoisomerase 1
MTQDTMPQSQTQMTLDKRTVERIRLIRRINNGRVDVNNELNLILIGKNDLSLLESKLGINKDSWISAKSCPKCENGVLWLKKPRKPPHKVFFGCTNFPKCRHSESK